MGEVISLSKHRKAKERAARQKQAEANRARFGRTKAQKVEEGDEARRAEQAHALLKFEPPETKPTPDKSGS
jgi:hypothetical protein